MADVRSFIALDLPPSIKQSLSDLIDRLSARVDGVRWVRPENIHLTLRFLGDVSTERLETVGAELARVGADSGSLRLSIGQLGAFPRKDRARVVWIGLAGQLAELDRLQGSVEEAMERIGFLPEKRGFRPHLTLGRVRSGAIRIPELGTTISTDFPVNEVKLMRSDLGPGGARYTCLRAIDLKS